LDQYVLEFVQDNYSDHNFYYYQDNSSVYSANIIKYWFQQNFTPGALLPVPPKSPDLNIIENVWGLAKVNVCRKNNEPTLVAVSEDDLWLSISDAWNDLREKDDLCQNLVDSMQHRIELVIEV
jgi:hypothetical protein